MRNNDDGSFQFQKFRRRRNGGRVYADLAGVLLLLDNFGIVWIEHVWDLWPLTLIAAGLAELLHWSRQRET